MRRCLSQHILGLRSPSLPTAHHHTCHHWHSSHHRYCTLSHTSPLAHHINCSSTVNSIITIWRYMYVSSCTCTCGMTNHAIIQFFFLVANLCTQHSSFCTRHSSQHQLHPSTHQLWVTPSQLTALLTELIHWVQFQLWSWNNYSGYYMYMYMYVGMFQLRMVLGRWNLCVLLHMHQHSVVAITWKGWKKAYIETRGCWLEKTVLLWTTCTYKCVCWHVQFTCACTCMCVTTVWNVDTGT